MSRCPESFFIPHAEELEPSRCVNNKTGLKRPVLLFGPVPEYKTLN